MLQISLGDTCISQCKKRAVCHVASMHLIINLTNYSLTRRICNDMMQIIIFVKIQTMCPFFRYAFSSFLIIAATSASAGVITQDGVVFTSTYSGNVLTLEIDAANRSGGWAGASAIDALSLKTIGSFSGVSMSSSSGAAWSLIPGELNARGCAARKGSSAAGMTRLCYTGSSIALADDMLFTFTFTGSPALSAPHLKVHFVDAQGSKTGSLLSLDFPRQAADAPAAGLESESAEVPEPRTLALMAGGLALLGLSRRRRN